MLAGKGLSGGGASSGAELREFVLSELRRRLGDLPGYVKAVLLFGSAARGEAGERSDVDLLVLHSGAPFGDPAERRRHLYKLVEMNLIVDAIEGREGWCWVDEPPPERNLELGIGKHVAWQMPLHREAVRRALKQAVEVS